MGVGDFEIVRTAGHQARRQALGFHGAGLVGHRHALGRGRVQRLSQRAKAKHLRRLRQPLLRPLQGVADAAIPLGLERVGQRQRQQTAHGVAQASVHQGLNLRGCDQATRCIVHQHPVLRLGAIGLRAPGRQTLAHGVGPAGAAAAQQGHGLARRWRRKLRHHLGPHAVLGREHHGHTAERGAQGLKRGQGVRQHGAAAQGLVLLGPGRLALGARPRAHPGTGDQGKATGR